MPQAQQPKPAHKPAWILPAVLLVVTAVAYIGTLSFQFVYDDEGQIVANPMIREWRQAPSYFTGHVWRHLYPDAPGFYYRPVFLSWLLLNYKLFHLNPVAWHATTLLLHLAVTLLVFVLARKLSGDRRIAAVAALVFGLHPARLEVAAWVSGSTESLFALLLLGSFLSYLRARDGKQWAWASSILLAAAAFLAKETALVLPLLVGLHAWFFTPARAPLRAKAALKSATPFLLVAAAYVVARIAATGALSYAMTPVPGEIVLMTAPSLLAFYVLHLLWPANISGFYDVAYVGGVTLRAIVLPLLLLAAVAGLVFWWWRRTRSPLVAFASLWLLVPLLPVLNLRAFPLNDIAHDRYLYVPSVGFALLVGTALVRFSERVPRLGSFPTLPLAGSVIVAALLLGTVTQSTIWASNLLLYHRGAKVAPNNLVVQNNLARTLADRGMRSEAIGILEHVVARDPHHYLALYNLGVLNLGAGKVKAAEGYLERAAAINPQDPDCLHYLGLARMQSGRFTDAGNLIERAISMRPAAPVYRKSLALVRIGEGRVHDALTLYRQELQVNPGDPVAQQRVVELAQQIKGSGR